LKKRLYFRVGGQDKEEEVMKMRAALYMTDVLMVLCAETLNALHEDILRGDIKP